MDQHDDRRVVSLQLGCTGDPSGADRPSAVVAESADGDPLVVPASALPAALEEGGAGEHWYHGDAAPYTHDEERRAGPRYLLWVSERMHAPVANLINIICFRVCYEYYFHL